MLAHRGEPLFFSRWDRAVFVHSEADPVTLQRQVPFELDLWEGRAFVSLVAFTMRRLRPVVGGSVGEWLLKPIGTHGFLNVRTYVRHRDETGIYFLAEWLSNRLSVHLGPLTFGLPYQYGRTDYDHHRDEGQIRGQVSAGDRNLLYEAPSPPSQLECSEEASLTEFLLERYTAFTQHGKRRQLFRVWHEPWLQTPIDIDIKSDDLLTSTGTWWGDAQLIGANYSPGVEVWMGRPHRA